MSDLHIKDLPKPTTSNSLTIHETSLVIGGYSSDAARLSFLQNRFDDVISGGAGQDIVLANDGRRDLVFDGDGSDLISSNLGDIVIRAS
ncbi:MAG: hypothetical protein AAF383_27210 [Cyanobacteria bacterium P01_A01_bin.83]